MYTIMVQPNARWQGAFKHMPVRVPICTSTDHEHLNSNGICVIEGGTAHSSQQGNTPKRCVAWPSCSSCACSRRVQKKTTTFTHVA